MRRFSQFPSFFPWRGLLAIIAMSFSLSACGSSDDGGGTDPGDVFNRAPNVGEINWANPYHLYIEGDAVDLRVDASDADGDSLRYFWDWVTAIGGSYNSPEASSVKMTVGSTVGLYQARVTVSDGKSSVSRVIGFTVAHALSGSVSRNTVWSAAFSPYVIVDDITVAGGSTLTIEPSVTLQLRRHGESGTLLTGIKVYGTLRANGSAATPVSFGANNNSGSQDVEIDGIEVLDRGDLELRFFRMKQASVGVLKRGVGNCIIEDGVFRLCQVGYQGLRDVTSGVMAAVTMRRVEIRDSISHGLALNSATADLEEVMIRNSGGTGLRVSSNLAMAQASAQVRRCELDSNREGNLLLDGNSWVDMGCSNLIPADSGKNVVLKVNGFTPGGTLPMTDCYWGLSDPGSEEEIRDQTFDGRIDANTWLRNTDLSGFRATAIDFNSPSDPCNP